MRRFVPANNTRITDAERAAFLRNHPGEWKRLTVHRSTYAAKGTAARIRRAYRSPAWEPAGAFETRTRQYGEDCTAVYARWLGPEHEARLLREATTDTTDTPTRTGGAR